jgi:1-pyrroline-5-carboxylate dehydrogenase
MSNAFFEVPIAVNEPVRSYAPGTKDREELQATYNQLWNEHWDIPMYIGSEEVRTGDTAEVRPPHDHQHVVGHYHRGTVDHAKSAIAAALEARKKWARMPWEQRASIFLKAADLLEGPFRMRMNASTMIAQSKNAFQAEIDAACELIDFFRFNVQYMAELYTEQPESAPGMWNRLEYRPLEGFVYAVTPFNFTSIAANLPASAAMMGNVVVWKPSDHQVYSAQVIMELFKEAGLPDGVINMIMGDPAAISNEMYHHKEFAGIHFTGSTAVFKNIWKSIGNNMDQYNSYPRIVGETGGKDFIVAHPSSNADEVATAMVRGAFEFQGQKCSAASRAYIPESLWGDVRRTVEAQLNEINMGSPDVYGNFINAVIHEHSFDKLAGFIDRAKSDPDAEVIIGGNYDKSKGWFIEPTVIQATDPKYVTMCEELFGPVLTVFVYKDEEWEQTLELVNATSPYALTGAVFSKDRYAANDAIQALVDCAGNFYVNDKPTGAVVGQQPFGGARASGTNDKAGSKLNLIRWVSPRLIKETFVPPTDYKYPFMG